MTQSEYKYKVLIVDDVPQNLQVLGNILDEHNIDISFAINGKRAIKLATINIPDLILLDISMPEMDGYEVCRELRKMEETKDIPVIFLTARTEAESIIEGFNAGGQDYVTKPFNSEELVARLFTHIELKNKRQQLSKQAEKLSKLNERLNQQKNEISQKNKFLTDSISYAQIIQNSLLSNNDKLKNFFPQSFIFYRPKDIVSGDFYFFDKIDAPDSEFHESTIIVAADCTGHGVPGALLTVLGITLLKQMIVYEKMANPAEILYRLNSEITDTLVNSENTERSQDGMDVAICTINKEKSKLIFAGCKRPLYWLRNNQFSVIKGSVHSIGGYYEKGRKKFENREIEIMENDRIFMFSDGYADQFGGERNKKFTRKRFRELLKTTSTKTIEKQAAEISKMWHEWRGKYEQVDDVMVLGFEI